MIATALTIDSKEFPRVFEVMEKLEQSVPEFAGRSTRQIACMLILEAGTMRLESEKEVV